MRQFLSAVLLLALASPSWADPPPLEIPAEIKAQPGAWVVVSPKTTAAAVLYVGLDGLSAFPSSELKDPRKLVVAAPVVAGRWRFVAVGTLKDEMTETPFSIVVGDAPPTPPVPPTPPGPTDPLTKTLQAAFDQETAPTRTTHLAALTALYRNAGPTCQRTDLKTAADLLGVLKTAAGSLLPTDALPKLRGAIRDELNKTLPTDPAAPLDQATRDKAAATFARVASALAGVK